MPRYLRHPSQTAPTRQLEQAWKRAKIHETTLGLFRAEAKNVNPDFFSIGKAVLNIHGHGLTQRQRESIENQVRNLALAAQTSRNVRQACTKESGLEPSQLYLALTGQKVKSVGLGPSLFGIHFRVPHSEIRRQRPNALAFAGIRDDEKREEDESVQETQRNLEKRFGVNGNYLRQLSLVCPRGFRIDSLFRIGEPSIHDHEQNHLISNILDAHVTHNGVKGQADITNAKAKGRNPSFKPIEESQANWKCMPSIMDFWKTREHKENLKG